MEDKIIEKSSSIIVDAHSHIGIKNTSGDFSMKRKADMQDYIDTMKSQNITAGIVMPVPSQVSFYNPTKPMLEWSYKYNAFVFNVNEPSLLANGVIENPYRLVNEFIFNQVSEYNNVLISSKKQPLYFVPLLNPLFDAPEYLLEMAKKYKPVALKIHGIASASSVEDISPQMISALKELNLPIIFHTDFAFNNQSALDILKNKCNSTAIAKWCVKNKIKGYLTHGARLDEQAFKIVNDNDNLVVGLGPDLRCNERALREIPKAEGETYYLQKLKDSLDISKIVFDIDYDWNLKNNGTDLDLDSVSRVKKIFRPSEQNNVLWQNAAKFFKLELKQEGEKHDIRKL